MQVISLELHFCRYLLLLFAFNHFNLMVLTPTYDYYSVCNISNYRTTKARNDAANLALSPTFTHMQTQACYNRSVQIHSHTRFRTTLV
jgi:hypothetical protein